MAVLRAGPLAIRWDRRALVVGITLVLLSTGVLLWSLTTGDLELSVIEVVAALTGSEDGINRTVVVTWRLPRVFAAAVFGAGLGIAGAIFQSLTRNPLASPDIIGFSAGAYTGALIVIIGVGGSYLQVAAGSLAGGLTTALVVYLLAYRGGLQGFRLIVVGIGVSAMLTAANTWMILRAQLEVAIAAAVWGAGSLNGIGWDRVAPACLATLALAVVVARFQPVMRVLEMGDDTAHALGVHVERNRLILLFTAVVLTAAITAAAGPITFIALAAPQIARRLTHSPGVTITASALTGALLLASADHAAQHLVPRVLPVGVLTVIVGGAYLIWLLIYEERHRTGGRP
ncbi:FecCD family ABC transporter permease [Mycolicibacterium goodii]|uniref:FecCD family ABC transporter permease n=1 Tax=Mycolicibacterium goodii TaxID=134601 RepID=UPI001BDD47BF|nr:iron chelate uptake ABC transporter family permease subunit [Mycolicibacterium goodii]MBU8829756.1 iron chelate uptake ABC transporter family permease subunit [Mycolicibacterium goodii]